MNELNSIQLTKNEALSLFCFRGLNPASLIREKQELLNTENHQSMFYDLRSMLLIVNILLNFKSEEVRYFIQDLCGLFINDIYKNNTETLSIKDVQFLIPILFKYHNTHDYRKINDIELDKFLVESVRKSLFKLKAIDSYQQLLF